MTSACRSRDVRGDVVEPVRADVAVAEAAQVGDDHVEAGGGQRLDHPPADPLRLRPAVHQQQRHAPLPGADVGLREAAAVEAVDLEPRRVDVGLGGHRPCLRGSGGITPGP